MPGADSSFIFPSTFSSNTIRSSVVSELLSEADVSFVAFGRGSYAAFCINRSRYSAQLCSHSLTVGLAGNGHDFAMSSSSSSMSRLRF